MEKPVSVQHVSTPSEKSLLDALQRGDRYACDDMVKQFAGKIYNLALRFTGHPDEAEEVLQETFIKACRSVGSFEGRSSLGTWLYRIASNNSLMRLRRRRMTTVSLDASTEEEGETFQPVVLRDWHWEPESVLLTEELRRVVDDAIATLPDSLRAAFVLRDLEGLSTREAADVLGISPGNLKVRLHRARLMLRERLATYFSEHPPAEGDAA
ncbi:MAG: sigma-70 family RNA polymerase sigma factor [Caldilineae bacterium]|nr:MAG: sigma-70 family RNA polymerase sigma factor [Caldilineae bacterium]